MKMKTLALAIASFAAVQTSVQAEELYGGVTIDSFNYEVDGSDDVSPTGLGFRLGTNVLPGLEIEWLIIASLV